MRYLKFNSLAILAICTVFISSCKDGKKDENTTVEDKVQTENLCYKNIYKFEDSDENIDVLELNLEIEGNDVSGNYNWLPALKDQRNGTITGTIDGKMIKATYTFQQEGISATAPLSIQLLEDKALLKTDDPNLGLDTEVAKIDCN